MTLPLYSTIIDRRDGARCAFHRWYTRHYRRRGKVYKLRRAKVAVLGATSPDRWRFVPERFVEPVLSHKQLQKKRYLARKARMLACTTNC